MSTTYGKWQVVELGNDRGTSDYWLKRTVRSTIFGFVRESVEFQFHAGVDIARLCRVLNNEPEPTPPEPKLDDRQPMACPPLHDGINHIPPSPYRFPTEALRAELARREAEEKGIGWVSQGINGVGCVPPGTTVSNTGGDTYFYSVKYPSANKRTGPADRRKASAPQPWEGGPDCPCGANPTTNHKARCPNRAKRAPKGRR